MPRPRRLDGPPTPREVQVLDLIRLGRTPKGIAYDMGITNHTVNHHLKALRTRYQATSNLHLVSAVLRAEIERLEDELKAANQEATR